MRDEVEGLLYEAVSRGETVKYSVRYDNPLGWACAVLGDQCAKKGLDGESLQWHVRAAKSSHVPAMLVEARCYRNGLGTAVDLVQAVRWLLAPLDRGNGDGIHEAIELASSMTIEQIREAGQLSGHSDEAELLIHRR
jgi:TPR repeat protein